MPMYEYECPLTGKRIEVLGRMSDPPPEWIGVRESEDGSGLEWISAGAAPRDSELLDAEACGSMVCGPDVCTNPHRVVRRVYCEGVRMFVPDYRVHHAGDVPVSKSLPRRNPRNGTPDTLDGHKVLRYKDGGYSNRNGQPIVRTKADRQNEEGRTGLKFD